MPFLTIDGLDLDALVDSAATEDVSVEDYQRGLNDELEGRTYSTKKSYSFRTAPLSLADARAIEGWIRGRRHHWSFDNGSGPSPGATTYFSKFSTDLGIAINGGTLASHAYVGRWGFLLRDATSGTSAAFTARFGSEGDWTVHFYQRPQTSPTFKSYIIRSLNGTISATADGSSVATVHCVSFTAVSGSLTVVLGGKNADTGTASTAIYDAISACPFAYTTDMIDAVKATGTGIVTKIGHTRPPYLTAHGDLLEASTISSAFGPGPVRVKGFVQSHSIEPLMIDGTLVPARILDVTLVQK